MAFTLFLTVILVSVDVALSAELATTTVSNSKTTTMDQDELLMLLMEEYYSRPNGITNSSYILSRCPQVSFERQRPIDSLHSALNVSLRFRPEFFYGINDVSETLKICALFGVYWEVRCDHYGEDVSFFNAILPSPDFFTKPGFRHLNSANDPGMNRDFDVFFRIESEGINPMYPEAENVHFHYERYGVFESFCNISLRYYPFGETECGIIFISTLNPSLINIHFITMGKLSPTFVQPRGAWVYVHNRTVIDIYKDGQDGTQHMRATFYLTFKRIPDYFIYNLLIPASVLTVLEIVGLLCPGRAPDRPAYTITILLSLTVLQGGVLDRVPVTSERIFLNDYILFSCLLATLITVYTCIICSILNSTSKAEEWLRRELKCCCLKMSITIERILDGIAIVFAVIFVIGLNLYALSVADSASDD